ncbi:MAG: hypothetical protein EOM23_08945 [Candidatus Moranbacteria bacterium]|nr:hypothetical protein [Candidatus Moranbacteria bacterium]
MANSLFSIKVSCSANELHKVEAFVEDICDYHNVFNVYFGNILIATSELFSFLTNLFPGKEIELYSQFTKGSLVVGYNIGERFNEVSQYYQKGLSGFIESEHISENEKRLLSTALLTDDIILDLSKNNLELIFCIKAEASHREKKISKYIESLSETKLLRANKGN